jgi:hypothetical protein
LGEGFADRRFPHRKSKKGEQKDNHLALFVEGKPGIL